MTLSATSDLHVTWARIGGAAGVIAVASYLAAAFVPMPDVLALSAAFAFGPLLAVGCVGLHRGSPAWSGRPLAQIAAGLAVAAGATVLSMLSVQQAVFATVRNLRGAGASGDVASVDALAALGNAVHLGIDVAWDVLISAAVILFGVAMLGRPGMGRIMGALGVALGALLLGFNLWYFPEPPASANSIDWGPFVALWLLVTFVTLAARRPWLVGR
jgi:hypothetical protein